MKGYFSFSLTKRRYLLFVVETLALFFSILLAYIIRYLLIGKAISTIPVLKIVVYFAILIPQVFLLFYTFGLYQRWEIGNFSTTLIKTLSAVILLGIINGFFFYFKPEYFIGRVVFIFQLIIYALLICVIKFIFTVKYEKGFLRKRVLFINLSDLEKKTLDSEVTLSKYFQFDFKDYKNIKSLAEYLSREVDKSSTIVVFSLDSKVMQENFEFLLTIKFNKLKVYDFDSFYINTTGKVPANSLKRIWNIISEKEFMMGLGSYYNIKRFIELILSLVLLIFLAPLILLIALGIKLTSRGPAFFVQKRLGLNKDEFSLIKFRTMIHQAELSTGPKWATKNDPRVTKLGRILRKTKLDEIPQLLNILKGEMSFVGNRPIRRYFADQLARKIPYYNLRFIIKPGLTGWSQVQYDYAGSLEGQTEKFKYELFYIKHMSFILDFIIILKTLKTLFRLKGNK